MLLSLSAICVAFLFLLIVLRMKRTSDRREMEQHSITAEELHSLLALNQDVLLFDVRQPLDLLAYPEIILAPGRFLQKQFFRSPSLSPKIKKALVYGTVLVDKAVGKFCIGAQ